MRFSVSIRVQKDKIRGAERISKKQFARIIAKVAKSVAEQARSNIMDQGLYASGHMHDTTRAVKINDEYWEVLSDASYAVYHEFGTVHMPARPWLGPAVELAKVQMAQEMRDAVTRSFR